ncbi:hypothetical protein HG535_0H00990 [Zygotorulaspora mrakii]|uniref:Ribosome-releasing factor 2, mitochondrial n=1 Tax=Zygotorulaspora mrakii TaxID=42260 RepID=A0A7H9B8C7_ZYGMR|nr:uncharacterized protein HG535_0H00990 [Zygotorulaspora mrakii]QLG74773.1 hypothetical protein HG535_0H00990 [Zygotorulaspora mrakii]
MLRSSLGLLRTYATRTELSKIRNIGIIAHIDAGKTTTTERMLYYSGKINRIGNVDQGDTITDFLPQEKSRGITIQSAAISFKWQKEFKINLIDTPGHADFTFEVIRALKVLDGCVTILDAVAGVEAQTEKVWRQSKTLPKICFINKMDRMGAGYSRTVKELIVKMKTRVALINAPFFKHDPKTQEQIFEGVIDVVNMKTLKWSLEDPDKIEVSDIEKSNEQIFEQLTSCRASLIETLGEYDEELVEHFLDEAEGDYLKIPAAFLKGSIRKATLNRFVTPILCGASFKNIGVQPLLDAIVDYLPSPIEVPYPELNDSNLPITIDSKNGALINRNRNLCVSLAFKVITDPIRGIMVFIRVYSGILNSGSTVFNSTTGEKFKIGKLVLMHADVHEEVNSLHTGEIGVMTGSSIAQRISTGDTVISHSLKKDGLKSLDRKKELPLKINPITVPPPVFSVTIEPRTLGNRSSMEDSLNTLVTEDPSLQITKDEETGQTILSGMGELHLEIAKYKLINELHAAVEIGKVRVSNKETLMESTSSNTISTDAGLRFTISVIPISERPPLPNENWISLGSDNNYLIMEQHEIYDPVKNWKFQMPYGALVNALTSSSIVALYKGGKVAGYPLYDCAVKVHGNWELPLDIQNPTEILSLSRSLVLKVLSSLEETNFAVLEPVMSLEVIVAQKDMGAVLQDLTGARDANILSIDDEHELNGSATGDSNIEFLSVAQNQFLPPDMTMKIAELGNEGGHMKVIRARVPLKSMVAYTNKFRSLTQGRGSFHMAYYGMGKVGND